MRKRSDEAFDSLGVRIQDTGARVANMSGGQRQGIAICRAVTWAKKVVFMDEPTAALGVVQTRNVLDQIKRVREHGLSVVLISHNMPEVFEVADRIEVLRLGARVARLRPQDVSMEDVVGGDDRRADLPRRRRGDAVMTTPVIPPDEEDARRGARGRARRAAVAAAARQARASRSP